MAATAQRLSAAHQDEVTRTTAPQEAAKAYARNITVFILLSSVVYLASMAALVWYGMFRFQDCL